MSSIYHNAFNPTQTTGTGTAQNFCLTGKTCTAGTAVADILRMNNSNILEPALADTFVNSLAMGVCKSKSNATTCDLIIGGLTPAIFSGLDVDKEYFLSNTTAGAITITPPSTGNVIIVGVAFSATELIFQPRLAMVRS